MAKKRIVVFSGAGMSAESGIQTFRDNDGLWEQHRELVYGSAQTFIASHSEFRLDLKFI